MLQVRVNDPQAPDTCEQSMCICLDKGLIQNVLEKTIKDYLTLGFGYIEKVSCLQPRKWMNNKNSHKMSEGMIQKVI